MIQKCHNAQNKRYIIVQYAHVGSAFSCVPLEKAFCTHEKQR